MTDRITVTEDLPACPQCGAPAVKTGTNDRICNSCGLTWTVRTEQDELDEAASREVRSREFNEERGRARKIGRLQTRW